VFFPNILMVGSEVSVTFQWRVPIDDEHTLHVSLYSWRGAPGAVTPTQDIVPYRETQLVDDQGRWIVDLVFNQDFMAWGTQGPIAQRQLEKLGESDVGLIMFRKQLRRELDVLADGGEPMNVFRDAEKASCLVAPLEQVKFGMRRPKKYIPGESGHSTDADKINEVIDSWANVEELASAPGAGEGE
jgi:5,5'-dehydrodivanillate O-demethylase